jgi:MoaA/NifB/PqqE/SkfB family radical SAM enzyme
MAETWGVNYHIRPVDAYVFHELKLADQPVDKNLYPCYMGFIQPTIMANGDVIICGGLADKPLGNLHKTSFKEIWQNSRGLRRWLAAMDCHHEPRIDGCRGCANAIASGAGFHKFYSRISLFRRHLCL